MAEYNFVDKWKMEQGTLTVPSPASPSSRPSLSLATPALTSAPPSSSPVPVLTPSQVPSAESFAQQWLKSVYPTEAQTPETKEKKRFQIEVDWMFNLFNDEDRSLNDYTPAQQTFMYTVAEFLEGFAWGADLVYGEDDLIKANKKFGTVANIGGDLARTGIEMIASAGIVAGASKAFQAASWTSKAFRYTKNIAKVEKYAPKLLSAMGNAAARGLVYSAIEQVFAPEERKPGLKGTAINVALFSGGELGEQVGRSLIAKHLPNASNKILGVLAASIGDSVGSFLASFPLVDDKENYIKDFGSEVIMDGVVDVVMWGLTNNKFVNNIKNKHRKKVLEAAFKEYQETGSEAAQNNLVKVLSDIMDDGVPEGVNQKEFVEKLVDEVSQDRIDAIKRIAKEPDLPVSSPAVNPEDKLVDEIGQSILKKGQITAEELDFLNTKNTPKKGAPLNTVRFFTEGENKRVLDQVARLGEQFDVETHELTKQKAQQNLDAAFKGKDGFELVNSLGRVLEEAKEKEEILKQVPEFLTRFRAINVSWAAEVRAQAKKVLANPDSDLEIAKYLYMVDIQSQLTGTLRGINNNLGRSLSAGNIVVGDKLVNLSALNPEDLLGNVTAQERITAMLDAAGGKQKVLKQAEELVKSKDFAEQVKNVRKFTKDKPIIRALIEGRAASLLTGPATHLTNITSQAFNQTLEHMTEGVAVAVGNVRKLFKGDYDGRLTGDEFAARVMGDVEGFVRSITKPIVSVKDIDGTDLNIKGKSALEVIIDILRYPEKLEEIIKRTSLSSVMDVEGFNKAALSTESLKDTKFNDVLNAVGGSLDKTRSVVRKLLGKDVDPESIPMRDLVASLLDAGFSVQRLLSFGGLELGDRLFAYGGYFSELNGYIHNLGKSRGLSGDDLLRFKEELKEQVVEYRRFKSLSQQKPNVKLPTVLQNLDPDRIKLLDEIDKRAMQHSNYMTWKDDIKSKFGKDFESFLQKNPGLKFILPFYHTPMKILEKVHQYTPLLNLFSKSVRADLSGINGERAKDMAIARTILGGTLYAIGWGLAKAGLITPTAKSPSQRKAMQEAGVPEHAIRIGDTWVDINKLDPAPASFFGIMADLANIINDPHLGEEDASSIATAIMLSITKNTLDKTYMKSLSDTLDAIYGSGTESYLRRFIDTNVPFYGLRKAIPSTKLGGLNPLYEEYYKEAKDLMSMLTNSGLDSLDSYGKPVANRTRFFGMDYRKEAESPIRSELIKLGISLPTMSDMFYGVKLTPEQHWELRRMLDTEGHLEDKLNQLVTSPKWEHYITKQKQEAIRKVYDNVRDKVRHIFLKKHPEVRKSILEALKTKRTKLLDPDAGSVYVPWITRGE